jgi:hypothetical protein
VKDRIGRTLKVDLVGRLRALSHPITGECLSDFERINGFVNAAMDAADKIEYLEFENKLLFEHLKGTDTDLGTFNRALASLKQKP